MYACLCELGVSVVSIGHRPSLIKYHTRILRLGVDPAESEDGANWRLEVVSERARDSIISQVL